MQPKRNDLNDLVLENKVFNFVLAGMILFVSYTVGHDIIFGSKQIVFLGDLITLCILIGFIFIYRTLDLNSTLWLLIPFLIIAVSIFWFLVGGIRGPSTFNFIALMVCITILTNGMMFYIFVGIIAAIQITLMFSNFWYPELFDFPLPKSTLNAIPYHFFFSSWITVAIIFFLKKSYYGEREKTQAINRELDEKNKEIYCQNEELHQQQETINKINLSLEEKVKERTHELESKSKQIQEFTYLNAHKLRGPLARSEGLVYLLLNESNLDDEQKLWVKSLQFSLEELDQVIYIMNKALDTHEQDL